MILITGNVLVPFVLSVFMLEDIYLSLRSMTDFGPFVDAVFFLLYPRFLPIDLASLLAGFVGFLPLGMFPLPRTLVPPILVSFPHQFLISSFLFLKLLILFSPLPHFRLCFLAAFCHLLPLIEGEIDGERCMLENILGRVRELSVC